MSIQKNSKNGLAFCGKCLNKKEVKLLSHVVGGEALVVPLRNERVVRQQREDVGADVALMSILITNI